MKRSNSTTVCVGLVTLTNLLFSAQVSIAGMDTASTNMLPRTDEQAVILLERMGRYEEAEAQCNQLLQQNPNDPVARRLLAEIEDAKHRRHPVTTLRDALDTIIIPEVNVRGAGVTEVIEFLQTESQKVSGAENPINFVWQAPDNLKTAKVTLNLRRVPLADVLKYVTESVGLRYRVDAHAVVIYQPPPAMPTESSPSNVKSP
jgi:hypothetical protein